MTKEKGEIKLRVGGGTRKALERGCMGDVERRMKGESGIIFQLKTFKIKRT